MFNSTGRCIMTFTMAFVPTSVVLCPDALAVERARHIHDHYSVAYHTTVVTTTTTQDTGSQNMGQHQKAAVTPSHSLLLQGKELYTQDPCLAV